MANSLSLESMSVEEKIEAMELLWEDLCKRADGVDSPAWHGDVLRDREQSLAKGESQFIDWGTAKKNIRNDIS